MSGERYQGFKAGITIAEAGRVASCSEPGIFTGALRMRQGLHARAVRKVAMAE